MIEFFYRRFSLKVLVNFHTGAPRFAAALVFTLLCGQSHHAQDNVADPGAGAATLPTTSLTLEGISEGDAKRDRSVAWLMDEGTGENNALFHSGQRRILVCDDPERNATSAMVPFVGDFDISARIGIEELPGGFYAAGFTVAWSETGHRDSSVVLTNQSLRIFARSPENNQEILHVVGKSGMGDTPWVRMRRLGSFVTVFISKDGSQWRERFRFPARGDRGRVGLALFGNPDLGPRLATFDHLHMALTTLDQETVIIDSLVESEDKDGNGLPDSFDKRVAKAKKDIRAPDQDADGDGVDNWTEFILATSPLSPTQKPVILPADSEEIPGMLVERWPYPENMYSLGTLPIEVPNFPLGAPVQEILSNLGELKVPSHPFVFRLRSRFKTGEGGFHEFQLRGVRTGRMTLREITPDGKHRFPTATVFAAGSNQRLGSGSIHLKRERWYEVDLTALHRNRETRPELLWAVPGAVEVEAFAPNSLRIPTFDPSDKDRDGLPDLWEEIAIGHTEAMPFSDSDRDGLQNLVEWVKGTDPLSRDTDGDGVEDKVEDILSQEFAVGAEKIALPGIPEHWEFGWIPPEQNPVGSEESRPVPERQAVFNKVGENEWTMVGDIATFRGNRTGWVPWLYRIVDGDFDLTTRIDFPAIPDELALLRSSAGGIVARQTLDDSRPFEFALAIGNLGETMVKLIPAPATSQKAHYEFGFGGRGELPLPAAWLRMIRRGNELIAAWSPDREVWMQTGPAVRTTDGPLLVGTACLGLTALSGDPSVRFRDTSFENPDGFARPRLLTGAMGSGFRASKLGILSVEDKLSMGLNADESKEWEISVSPGKALTVPASLERVVSGDWAAAGSRGVYVRQGSGAIEFRFDLASDGLNRAILEAGPALNYGGSIEALHDISIQLDGKPLKNVSVIPRNDGVSEFALALPFLESGSHKITVSTFSPRAGLALPLKSLRIEPLNVSVAEPSASEENGDEGFSFFESLRKRFQAKEEPKVDETESDATTRLVEVRNEFPSGAYQSPVSPAFVEGRSFFPESVSAKRGPQADSKSNLPVVVGPDGQWYIDLPLSPDKTTPIAFQSESGSAIGEATWEWTPLNVLDGGKITIRRGDSLLLAAQPGETGSADVNFLLSENEKEIAQVTVGETFSRRFDKNGTFKITASGKEGEPLASLIVEVPRAEFSGNPIVVVGRERNWDLPRMDFEGAMLDSDSALSLEPARTANSGLDPTYALASEQPGEWKVAMRLPSGVVSDVATVDAVRLFHATETSIDQVSLGAAGRMMSLQWAVPDTSSDLRYQVRIMAATGVFSDGSIVRTLNMANRDSKGRLGVQALQPPGETRALCHQVFVFDGESFIGSL